MTLDQIKVGDRVSIVDFRNSYIANRLMSMGVLPGVKVTLRRKSLLGSTYFLQFPNLDIALRKDEAAQITIE